MTYVCPRTRGTAKVVCVLLFILAAVTGVFSSLGIGWKGLWQLIMFGAIVGVVYVSQRYLLTGYEYILAPHEEIFIRNRITVVRTQGKKRIPVVTLSLKNLTGVIPYMKYRDLREKYGSPSVRMSLCADMFPRESYILLFETNGELSAVRIQCDKNFSEEIASRAGV